MDPRESAVPLPLRRGKSSPRAPERIGMLSSKPGLNAGTRDSPELYVAGKGSRNSVGRCDADVQ